MLDPSLGRASYIFNPTIEGIEQADALLIVGSNPRLEAAVLNARIRKRWRMDNFPIGVIGEQGELLVRGPQVFAGYWGRPEETADQLLDGGWLRTGDIVRLDEQGFVVLVDRIKEVIVTGGFNVYPSQVEDHLRTMPGVRDVAVVGVPGGDLGEKVVAAVVLDTERDAAATIDLAAVRAWCAQRLAGYAVPRGLVVVPDLPRSILGKVLRRVVRDDVLAATSAP